MLAAASACCAVQPLRRMQKPLTACSLTVDSAQPVAAVQTSRTTNRNRLAAAMGWTTVLQPFKVLAGGNINKAGAGKDAHAQRCAWLGVAHIAMLSLNLARASLLLSFFWAHVMADWCTL